LKCGQSSIRESKEKFICACGQKYKKINEIPVITLNKKLELFYDY